MTSNMNQEKLQIWVELYGGVEKIRQRGYQEQTQDVMTMYSTFKWRSSSPLMARANGTYRTMQWKDRPEKS